MGKKAKFKLFRRMAAEMPMVSVNAIIGDKISGKEAMLQGINEIDGLAVNQSSVVIRKKIIEKPLNHNRQMKRLYNQKGEAGVQAYLKAVKEHVERKNNN